MTGVKREREEAFDRMSKDRSDSDFAVRFNVASW
jgi:hypothetical protein